MPPDPTANLGSKRMETLPDYIGHVAPDFRDRKIFNTLVVRPQFRISLRLGEIEELFPNPPNTVAGRMERLQVLGMFYFPLGHARARQAFNGLPAAIPPVRGIWDYFKTRILDAATDAAADTEIQRLLRDWIVAGGALPPPTDSGAAPANANFAKVRLPGGYTFLTSWASPGLGISNDPAPNYANWGWNNRNLYDSETQYRTDNVVLGKIPLIAKVEKFDTASAKWKPITDAQVYFQLVDAYPLPAFDPAQPVNAQLNRPPLRDGTVGPPAVAAGTLAAGPGRFTNAEENPTGARQPNATDPQRGNCPQDRGGEQGKGNLGDGTDVANVIFSTTSLPGFNAAHGGATPNPITRTNFFPLAEQVNDASHLHAVKAKTNADGEAGVLFTPARCGGDRYRLRAYLGPPTLPGGTGDGGQAVVVETGTFVVWRNLRLSRYVRQPAGTPDPALLADAVANLATATVPIANNNDYLRNFGVVNAANVNVGLPTANLSTTFSAAAAFSSLPVQWARAFVEVEIDRAAQAALPEVLTQADWQAARRQALADGRVGMGAIGLNLDLARLLYMEPGAPASINVNSAIVHLPMRSTVAYNNSLPPGQAARRFGAPGNTVANVQTLIWNYLLGGFIRSLSSNGYTPGLVAVQGAFACTWQLSGSPNGNFPGNSGLAFEHRGGYVWMGSAVYPTAVTVPSAPGQLTYDFTSNTCHELGHCCYRDHGAPPGTAPVEGMKHDPTATNLSICVMSYQACEGQFCSKCLFSFRGWNLATLTY